MGDFVNVPETRGRGQMGLKNLVLEQHGGAHSDHKWIHGRLEASPFTAEQFEARHVIEDGPVGITA